MTDMFCGAGGSSTGATMIPGISVKTALNHWQKALDSHNANHPDTIHVQTHGLFAKDLYIPATAIAEVEPNRVELNVPKNDLNGRGWENPPG